MRRRGEACRGKGEGNTGTEEGQKERKAEREGRVALSEIYESKRKRRKRGTHFSTRGPREGRKDKG